MLQSISLSLCTGTTESVVLNGRPLSAARLQERLPPSATTEARLENSSLATGFSLNHGIHGSNRGAITRLSYVFHKREINCASVCTGRSISGEKDKSWSPSSCSIGPVRVPLL
jgi:hypothetical protein